VCSACGIPTHVLELDQVAPADEITAQAAQVAASPAKFAASRNADCRPYLFGAVVQLLAPPAERGRVIGLYGVSADGLRAGSGFTVGLLGAAVGIHWSLGLSAAALCLGTVAAGIYALRGGQDTAPDPDHPDTPGASPAP
jgi:hypothetical protein